MDGVQLLKFSLVIFLLMFVVVPAISSKYDICHPDCCDPRKPKHEDPNDPIWTTIEELTSEIMYITTSGRKGYGDGEPTPS